MFCFLGIGAQKSGTTWLYTMLAHHPAIDFPGPRNHDFWHPQSHPGVPLPGPKEQHFWDRWDPSDAPALRTYLALFDHGVRCQGDITPSYALLPADTIRLIRGINPDLRLLYLLRNPIERAWSSALMALRKAELRIEEASDQWFLDHFRSQGSLRRGDYEQTLRRWHAEFPREQLLVERFDSLTSEPRALLGRVAAHLGVAAEPLRSLPDALVDARVYHGPGTSIRPALRPALEDLYGPRIESLSAYLQRPLAWT